MEWGRRHSRNPLTAPAAAWEDQSFLRQRWCPVLPIFVAIAVLAAAAVVLISLRSRAERDIAVSARAARITGSLPVSSADAPDAAAALAAAEAVGSAMIQAGYSVETVQDVLGDIARVNGLPESEVLVFPTRCWSRPGGRVSIRPERSPAVTGSCCSPRSTKCSTPSTPPVRGCSIRDRRSRRSRASAT